MQSRYDLLTERFLKESLSLLWIVGQRGFYLLRPTSSNRTPSRSFARPVGGLHPYSNQWWRNV
jgi:hypothetical protein